MCCHPFWPGQYSDKVAGVLRPHLIQLKYTLKHWKSTFCYSPLVLWWPPLLHFQEKGIFFWPFLGFHTYFKIPIASLTLGKERFTMASNSCCIVQDNFQQNTQRSWRCRGSCGLVGLE